MKEEFSKLKLNVPFKVEIRVKKSWDKNNKK